MDWLKELRLNKNMTIRYVAEQVGVTESFISLLEHNKKRPSVALAKRLATLFDIDWTKFFD